MNCLTKWIFTAVCVLGLSPLAARANDNEIISPPIIGSSPNAIQWRIDQPRVTVRKKEYPQIKFGLGDVVTVTAGGAVQTGGSGATWKRYVDPSGPNSNNLYHGLIKVEGVTNAFKPSLQAGEEGLIRMQTFMTSTKKEKGQFRGVLRMPKEATPAQLKRLFLQLGYEDDNYSDNGYYSHDDGTGDQAKGVGSAYVIIDIDQHKPVKDPAVFENSFASKDAAVRRRAAEAAGELGRDGAFAEKHLTAALKDKDEGVRTAASKALKLIGGAKVPPGTEPLKGKIPPVTTEKAPPAATEANKIK
jgi:hypothetical protein